MNDLTVNPPIFNQPFHAIGLDEKPVIVWYLARVADRERTWAVSVPPHGEGRWMCIDHWHLFKAGRQCPVCAGTTTAEGRVSRVVTPPNSNEIAEKVD